MRTAVQFFTSTRPLFFVLVGLHFDVETKRLPNGQIQGELEQEFLNRARGRDPHPLCDADVDLKTKLEACVLVWNRLHDDSPELGRVLTPAADWKTISNKCERFKVAFRILRFPAQEENAFHCRLSALRFDVGQVSPPEEFYLSQGVVAQPDSIFVLRDIAHDPDFAPDAQKYADRKPKHLALQKLIPEIGMVHEQISL